jgi:glucose-6-phosphate 1-epimerase
MARISISRLSFARKNKPSMSEPVTMEIPGHLSLTDGPGGLRKVLIHTAWSDAEVFLHGGQVTHFQRHGQPPLLFLSERSAFLPGKPIRGGIPIIFPWFGNKEGQPAHGFARTAGWQLTETARLPDSRVSLRLQLPACGENFPAYRDLHAELLITVGKALTLELSVTNHGQVAATFETCLHTYLQLHDLTASEIHGLGGTDYFDKVTATTAHDGDPSLRISAETDRVYHATTATVSVIDPGHQRCIFIEKSGSQSTVVWNPGAEKSQQMPDLAPADYRHFLGLESGNLAAHATTLSPGERAVLRAKISSIAGSL